MRFSTSSAPLTTLPKQLEAGAAALERPGPIPDSPESPEVADSDDELSAQDPGTPSKVPTGMTSEEAILLATQMSVASSSPARRLRGDFGISETEPILDCCSTGDSRGGRQRGGVIR